MVSRAKALGYRGLGLTDHGNMSGSVQLYKECKKAGIKPFPGTEIYLVKDRADKKAKRYHAGLIAYTTQGYRNLVHINTRMHRQFHNKPLLDLADLADLHDQGRTEGIALMTGCYFGMVIQTLIKDGYDPARQLVAALASWFDTYVEIQYHNIDHPFEEGTAMALQVERFSIKDSEREIAYCLLHIAEDLDLPVIITQDSHYTYPQDRPAQDALKNLVSWGTEQDDSIFPGDGFHMASEQWMRDHHTPEIFEAGLQGLDRLISKHDMVIPEMEEYHYRIPKISTDPLAVIRERCESTLMERGLYTKQYLEQLDAEMEILEAARMGDYIVLVAEVCDHMREVNMFFQIRGSAGGSLVCWLMDITNVNPLKWKLRFDRFLTKDRMKPPDIDIDVENDRRQELLEWMGTRFAVIQICTFGTYSIAGEEGDTKGSLRVKYLSRKRKTTGEADWSKITKDERDQLDDLAGRNLVSSYGVHAAGVIVTTSRTELEDMMPFQWVASSKTMVSQYDGKDTESIGLVKLDVLGVKTLSVLRRTIVNMGLDPADGLDFIPFGDRQTLQMISKGDTDGVFQLEGYTSAKNITRLRPSKIGDVIAAMALFRPGVMNSGAMDTYLARKSGRMPMKERHPVIEKFTKETFGILLYQDQVIEILRELGFNADDMQEFLTAVKASNKNVAAAKVTMEKYEPIVREMCHDAGMTQEDYDWLQEALTAFAEYSFNRAHATIYGITAYRCAYLASKYPVEFHAALLAVAAGTDKEQKYISTTVRRGIKLLKPDVNSSAVTYTVDPQGRGVRKGLVSIKGIGQAVANAIIPLQPFESMEDFTERVNSSVVSGIIDYRKDGSLETGKIQVLHEAGALKSLL